MANEADPENRSSTYPLSRLSAAITPVDQKLALSEAGRMLGAVATGKLRIIQQQILHLQEEARRVIEEAEEDMRLHSAACGFTKRPGQVYHLYLRGPSDSDVYFSLLSPDEWGITPHPHLGSYKLEVDLSWTRVVHTSSEDITVESA